MQYPRTVYYSLQAYADTLSVKYWHFEIMHQSTMLYCVQTTSKRVNMYSCEGLAQLLYEIDSDRAINEIAASVNLPVTHRE